MSPAQHSNPLRVLHVVPGLQPGGMELAMARVITGLSDSTMQHSIACLKEEPAIADKIPHQTTIYCFHAQPNEPQLPFRLANLIYRTKPDVIHSRNWGAWPDMAVGRLLTRPLVPFIYSFHGLGIANYMPWRRRLASKVLVHLTTHLFTVSRQSRAMLVEHWGWPEQRTSVIPNGVDTQRFFPNPQPRAPRAVIGSVGNLRTVKNHALIVRACARLVKDGMDLEVRIAGEGDQREPLTALADSLGMKERLKLPGRVDDIPRFLNALDVFVLSSDSEQHPNALNEAMACGVAAVSTRVGCVDDLLDGGRCGKIIAPDDEEGLTRALRELLEDATLCARLAATGLEHVQKHYSLDVMLRRYRDLYLRAAGRAGT